MRRRFGAFTLVELLVVIVIIAILAAVLLPVFARSREKARQAGCNANLKQLGLAMIQYVHDYDERFPYNTEATQWHCYVAESGRGRRPGLSVSWTKTVQPYARNFQLADCPSAQVWFGGVYAAAGDEGDYMWHAGDGNDKLGGLAGAQLREPARTPMGWDGWGAGYHNDGFNVIACDGHTKYYKAAAGNGPTTWSYAEGEAGSTGRMDPKPNNPM